ncbi:9999_t:CDS:2, partial [Dentiscutata erythropus]
SDSEGDTNTVNLTNQAEKIQLKVSKNEESQDKFSDFSEMLDV